MRWKVLKPIFQTEDKLESDFDNDGLAFHYEILKFYFKTHI